MAGLTAAVHLHEAGHEVRVLEASDRVGGRVATDEIEGFKLDRGFQVLMKAYPECQRVLDYGALKLHDYYRGADIRHEGAFHRMCDPFGHPEDVVKTLNNPVLHYFDMFVLARLPGKLRSELSSKAGWLHGMSTYDYLNRMNIGPLVRDTFFKPFFGGVFLEDSLETPASMFAFVYPLFAKDAVALPEGGMGAIPAQLAARLPEGSIWTHCRVAKTERDRVWLEDGRELKASAVVMAADPESAAQHDAEIESRPWRGTTTLYFAAPKAPMTEPILVLNGDGEGPVNHLCVPSNVSPSYAPKGRALISMSVIGSPAMDDETLGAKVIDQMRAWYGGAVEEWNHLRTYRIEHALPRHDTVPAAAPASPRTAEGLYRCGDYCVNASINGAMESGRYAAKAVIDDLGQPARSAGSGVPAPEPVLK